ncbi:MAG: hypothetical protein EWM72_03360 [Nitrospira sp.]|nr:MAG: hypothetical protein EWM72_03360 [Nitrospira sp.]
MLKIYFIFRWLCLVAVAVALAGCADSPAKRGTRAYENKKNMVGLKQDMTTEEVTKVMGPPDKIVMHRGKDNETVLTYLYITQYIETYTSRGWSQDNYTPFIFVNDRLSGWGWNHLDNEAKRYEFDIRTTPFLAPSP